MQFIGGGATITIVIKSNPQVRIASHCNLLDVGKTTSELLLKRWYCLTTNYLLSSLLLSVLRLFSRNNLASYTNNGKVISQLLR